MFVIPVFFFGLLLSIFPICSTPIRQVNRLCSTLTEQVRSVVMVTTAVAKGDLTCKFETQFKGEMAMLKTTVNSMVEHLSAFASEITRVTLEVGTQDTLGGRTCVETFQGTWADLTLNLSVRFLISSIIQMV